MTGVCKTNHFLWAVVSTEVHTYVVVAQIFFCSQQPHVSDTPVPMELLPVNRGSGQVYGYVLYRTYISSSTASLSIHGLRDYGLVSGMYVCMVYMHYVTEPL